MHVLRAFIVLVLYIIFYFIIVAFNALVLYNIFYFMIVNKTESTESTESTENKTSRKHNINRKKHKGDL